LLYETVQLNQTARFRALDECAIREKHAMTLASKIKALRMKSGKSLQEVADAVGASKAHMWDIERGASKNPSLDLLGKLAGFYRIPIADLVGENPNASGEPEELIVMYRDLKELDPRDREVIAGLMEQMKARKQS
jgi:transcriptional regulator with XRE-family HTH domain